MNLRSTLIAALALGTFPLCAQQTPPSAHHHHIVFPAKGFNPGAQPVGLTPYTIGTVYNYYEDYVEPGGGQIIALVDAYDDPTAESDLGVFDAEFDAVPCTTMNGCFSKIYATGVKPATNASWATEIALDVEWAHALAPFARILLVEAPSSSTSDLLAAVQVAMAHGATIISMSWGTAEYAGETISDAIFQSGVQGHGIGFVAAAGDNGHGVEYPSASPFVVGVGGTTLSQSDGNYLGEVVWNNSLGATGGGVSAFESEPEWQGPFQSQGHRGVPDLAFDADPATGVAVYSTQGEAGQKGWMQIGGTSVGAPSIAALFATTNSVRANEEKGSLIFPTAIYQNSGIWNDITSGTNGRCGALCDATPGYDFTTGLGTPIWEYFISALSGYCY